MSIVRITDFRQADDCPTRREPSNVDHGSCRHDGLLRARHALGAGGEAVRDSHAARGGRRPGHGRAGLHAGPRRAAGVDLQPAHGRPQEQGAPGRNLLPHHPQRAEPARHLEDGGRCRARVPRRLRRARPSRRPVRPPPEGRRLVRRGLPARDAPCSGQGAERQRLPAGRARRLLSPVPLHRRQSVSGGSAQAARRRRRRQRLQQAARHLPSADARRRHALRLLRLHDGRPQVRPPDLHASTRKWISPRPCGPVPTGSPTSPPPSPAAAPRPTGRPSAWRISPPTRPRAARPSPSWRRR